jgi:hypothetical protein
MLCSLALNNKNKSLLCTHLIELDNIERIVVVISTSQHCYDDRQITLERPKIVGLVRIDQTCDSVCQGGVKDDSRTYSV